jgi:hypothetical protein
MTEDTPNHSSADIEKALKEAMDKLQQSLTSLIPEFKKIRESGFKADWIELDTDEDMTEHFRQSGAKTDLESGPEE